MSFVRHRSFSNVGVGKGCVLPMRVPNPSPTLDKNLASMGPGLLSSTIVAEKVTDLIQIIIFLETVTALRAKGTLISEPRFPTPCEMRFFPREKGKIALIKGFSWKRLFPFSRGKNCISQGVGIRGSLSVPLALR